MIGWTDAEIHEAVGKLRDARSNRERNVSRVRRFARLLRDDRMFHVAAHYRELSRQSKVNAI